MTLLALREMPFSRHNHSMQVKHWFQRAALPSGKHQAWFLYVKPRQSLRGMSKRMLAEAFVCYHMLSGPQAVWGQNSVLPCFCRVYPLEFICVGPDEKRICFVYGSSDCALIAR